MFSVHHLLHMLYCYIYVFFFRLNVFYFSPAFANAAAYISLSFPLLSFFLSVHTHTHAHRHTYMPTLHKQIHIGFWTLQLSCILVRRPTSPRVNAAAPPFLWEISITHQLKYSCFTSLLTVLDMQNTYIFALLIHWINWILCFESQIWIKVVFNEDLLFFFLMWGKNPHTVSMYSWQLELVKRAV